MILRPLHHLNPADLRDELCSIGVTEYPDDLLEACSSPLMKLSHDHPAGVRAVHDALKSHSEAVGIVGCALTEPRGLIFEYLPNCLVDLAQRLSGRAEPAVQQFAKKLATLAGHLSQRQWSYLLPGGRTLNVDRPLIMGILNVTPDSFSDGGQFDSTAAALNHAQRMLAEGVDIIDVGGESTRPGAMGVDAASEWRRVGPVIEKLAAIGGCVISIDTTKSEVARRALDAGAHIINDISGATLDPAIADVAAKHNAPLILMHIQGTPRRMQENPSYIQLMTEIYAWLSQRCEFARSVGVSQLIVDPGIGFGKTLAHNLEILRRLGEFRGLGYPVLLGTSRKSFLGKLSGASADERLIGTLTSNVASVLNGASILRVHDVRPHCEMITLLNAVQEQKEPKNLVI